MLNNNKKTQCLINELLVLVQCFKASPPGLDNTPLIASKAVLELTDTLVTSLSVLYFKFSSLTV